MVLSSSMIDYINREGFEIIKMKMISKTKCYICSGAALLSPGRLSTLFLTGFLALSLAGCGGSNGGNNGTASTQCTLTQEELDNLTPDDVDSLPKACEGIGFFDTPSIVSLFILGTEIDGGTGDLKLYVHGVKRDGRPMTLADFQQAAVLLDAVAADPADWDVAPAPAGVLSIAMLADYSTSITDADLLGMGGLYDIIVQHAPQGFEGEVINFSDDPATLQSAITVKPEPGDHWTEDRPALRAANDFDPNQPRNNTTLFEAMGTGLMGPLDNAFNPLGDDLGLVERNRPASVIIVQTDGLDNASTVLVLGSRNPPDPANGLVPLIDRCHTVAVMLGTFRSEVDAQVLEDIAGERGAAVNALNTNFLEAAIGPYAESLGNLVVFTLKPATLFADKVVTIEVDGLSASEIAPFDIDGGCQIP